MAEESALWNWFLFQSGLPTQRAKALLMDWQERGVGLAEALTTLQTSPAGLGLTAVEAALVEDAFGRVSPGSLSGPPAVTSVDPLYPGGLGALAPRLRPALLFYHGEPTLLDRTVVYLPPGRLEESDLDRASEVVSLLLGEQVLLGVYQDSDQASLVLKEMVSAEGEALLFARSGLESLNMGELETALVEAGRLLIVSPLPPEAAYQAAWESILQQVALCAADRIVLTGAFAGAVPSSTCLASKPVLVLEASEATSPDSAAAATSVPADVLDWILGAFPPAPSDSDTRHIPELRQPTKTESTPTPEDAYGLDSVESTPPPSPKEILDTLSRGGAIPDVLRRRLLDDR